jgi:serine/threonine-protein kinase HipA
MTVEELKPAPNDDLQRWMMSRRVNSSKADKDDPTPGAIVARLEAGQTAQPVRKSSASRQVPDQPVDNKIRFSLAGVQLKFSMTKRGSFAMPALDQAGDLILKMPSPMYPLLPELEFSALNLAAVAGVRVVEASLVKPDSVEGLPREFLDSGEHSLAVRRFDRAPGECRIHIEDFAQIVGAIDERKYTMANTETVLNMVRRFTSDPRGELLEAIRRVVVDLMLGNGDAHLKNWSFIYTDGRRTELSPAYDMVPTFHYGDGALALKFGGTNNPFLITLHRFERAAGLWRVDPKVVIKEVRLTVERILDMWPKAMEKLPLPEKVQQAIKDRWPKMALVGELRPTMAQGIPPATAAQGDGSSAVR